MRIYHRRHIYGRRVILQDKDGLNWSIDCQACKMHSMLIYSVLALLFCSDKVFKILKANIMFFYIAIHNAY